jgi:octaprenyl-diphosphate synthase
MTAQANPVQREALKNFGLNLGVAFQIKDDLLDYQSHVRILGKPVGNDLKDKKITLPLLYAFGDSDRSEKKRVLRMLKNGVKRKEIDQIVDFIIQRDGIKKAEDKAVFFKDLALRELEKLPVSAARKILGDLAEFVVHRSK